MILNQLSLHPKQYFKLKEPLKLYVPSSVSQDQFAMLCDALARRKIPLVISSRQVRGTSGTSRRYYLQMPTFSVRLKETDYETRNFGCYQFVFGEGGRNKNYDNPHSRMFLLETAMGTSLVYEKQLYHVSTDGTWGEVPDSEHVDWGMDYEAYDELLDRMESYFRAEEEFVRSQRVSERMQDQILRPFEQYTAKEHEFETREVDFTKGVLYTGREAGAVSSGKKSSFVLTSTDASADPETCSLAVGQQVALYRQDHSPTGLVGLLAEIDSETTDSVRFTLEFYQQFHLDQLPDRGYLFVHQNDTQAKIRKAVARSIYSGKTPAKYMYKTFHDYTVQGYEDPRMHPGLTQFLHDRMGRRFPPNQMQLEAIVKGILTEDLLLVLGPPGTGKTTVIVSWVEYYLSQGKRVLISSQNNAAVDNVLERLGDDETIEIVRLGREEKIHENCQKFIPFRKIETMRATCSENGRRLETQLSRERSQISAYISALNQLRECMEDAERQKMQISRARESAEALISSIKSLRQNLRTTQQNIRKVALQIARYEIFLEESSRQPALIRMLQSAGRFYARKKILRWEDDISILKAAVSPQEQKYAEAVKKLENSLSDVCSSRFRDWHRSTEEEILRLRKNILFGGAGVPALMPVFESELRYLEQAQKPRLDAVKILSSREIAAEIETMTQIAESADKILQASRSWVNTALKDDRNDIFEEILLDVCQVVGATCIGINSNKQFTDVNFDVTIIDESGQIQIHNAMVPMSRSPKTLMLGDYKQIPPVVNDEIVRSCEAEDISTTLFTQSFFEFLFEKMRRNEIRRLIRNPEAWIDPARLDENGEIPEVECREYAKERLLKPAAADYQGTPLKYTYPDASGKIQTGYASRYTQEEVDDFVRQIISDPKKIVNLNSQFRMPGHISDVISEWFYESNYFSSYSMENFRLVVPHTGLPMAIINTSGMAGRFESQPESKMGYQNLVEAELVADVLEAVLAEMGEEERMQYRNSLDKQLGVISAYGAQVRCIRQTLKKRLGFSDTEASTSVASLDSFQGQERDLIIYSLTRSAKTPPKAARVSFLKELRRLNVAFTRCKKQLVIIGDLDYLQTCRYVRQDDDYELEQPCAATRDDVIGKIHIDQCAECPLDCERRFSRFFRLLMQHAQGESPAGDLFTAVEFKKILKGENSHD